MMPSSNKEHNEFTDLIQKALFYLNLEDKYIQEGLCKSQEDEQKLPKFLEEAVKAEAHRKAFVEIGTTGAKLDNTNGITVAHWDVKNKLSSQNFFQSSQLS